MPTRTINLKMVLGKKGVNTEVRNSLWTTHLAINQAVSGIEKTLLLCRGEEYTTTESDGSEIVIGRDEVRGAALRMAREAQYANIHAKRGEDEDVIKCLRDFYEQMVPSCLLDSNGVPQKGDSQKAGALVSPLMDKDSTGGLSVYGKVLDPPPGWVTMMENGEAGWESASSKWLDNAEAKQLQSSTGSPSAWVRRLRVGKPWQDSFVKDQNDKRKSLESGSAPVIKTMKAMGLLPLIKPFIREKVAPDKKGVTPWDRMAVRLAVSHLLSWESWNHATLKKHSSARNIFQNTYEKHRHLENYFELLRQYEINRHEELKQVAFASDDRPYRVKLRSIRSWADVRSAFINAKNSDDRKQSLKELQTRLGGSFGDPHFFLWLAESEREMLWRAVDSVTPFVELNLMRDQMEKLKPQALMSVADAAHHPRWVMFEAVGGTNLRNYRISKCGERLAISIKLLSEQKDGFLGEKEFLVRLAPSGQLSGLELKNEGKKTLITYKSNHQVFEGVPGGSEVLFDRGQLEKFGSGQQTSDMVYTGPVWFKLTLDVKHKIPAQWLNEKGKLSNPLDLFHFRTALSKKSKYSDKLEPGLRVMSVDLGVRTFASCSVFELVRGKPEGGTFFASADGLGINDPLKLWAKHERSFRLCLPGEKISGKSELSRRAAMDELRSLRSDIRILREILRLGVLDKPEERIIRMQELSETVRQDKESGADVGRSVAEELKKLSVEDIFDDWRAKVQQIHELVEVRVARKLGDWRKRTRARSSSWDEWNERRGYAGGKSVWAIDYLESVRRLLMSWNLRGRKYGEVNRQDRAKMGTIASRLLHHINNVKEDRIKTGADLLIQSALGFVPDPKGSGWVRKFEPCRVILFEDLARYRFRVDRPRRENSQLMKWNHREILHECEMQGEIYGLIVETTEAGFSSRFLASTGTPGVRCRYLVADDFTGDGPKDFVLKELDWMLGNSKKMSVDDKRKALSEKASPGALVPWRGGELFMSVRGSQGRTHVIHADINAAQNLQRRFWGRCGEAFRLACKQIDDTTSYLPSSELTGRLLGAAQAATGLKGPFYLRELSSGQRYRLDQVDKGTGKACEPDREQFADDDPYVELEEILEAFGSERQTFFRDPSGVIFNMNDWIPTKQFWSIVRSRVWGGKDGNKR